MRLELIFAESAFNKTCLYRRVRAPITKTTCRPNITRQRAKSKKSATPTSKGKFYENADSANINVRRTVVGPPLIPLYTTPGSATTRHPNSVPLPLQPL